MCLFASGRGLPQKCAHCFVLSDLKNVVLYLFYVSIFVKLSSTKTEVEAIVLGHKEAVGQSQPVYLQILLLSWVSVSIHSALQVKVWDWKVANRLGERPACLVSVTAAPSLCLSPWNATADAELDLRSLLLGAQGYYGFLLFHSGVDQNSFACFAC